MNLIDYALRYELLGWFVLPIHPTEKKPLVKWADRKNQRPTPMEIKDWWQRWSTARIGIATGFLSGIDVVDLDGPEAFEKCIALCGELPNTLSQLTGRPEGGRHLFFKHNGLKFKNHAGEGIDLRTDGGIVVIAPSSHPSGNCYRWDKINPIDDGLDDLAQMPASLVEYFSKFSKLTGRPLTKNIPLNLEPALPGERHQKLTRLVGRWITQGLDENIILLTARGWYENLPDKKNFPVDEFEQQVFDMLSRYREGTKEQSNRNIQNADAGILSDEILDALGRGEDGDSELFIKQHRGHLCFDHASRRWYEFAGHYWSLDRRENALASVSKVIDLYAGEAKRQAKFKHAATGDNRSGDLKNHEKIEEALLKRIMQLHSVQKKQNVLALSVAGDGSLGISGDEWDADPWVLGCPNGVVDLKTGELRPGRPPDYIRTVANVEWKGIDAPCSSWECFLSEVFDGDTEVVSYMQHLIGYGLIGDTPLHIIPILWGRGRNGKGTLLEIVKHVLGPYAFKAEAEILLDQRTSKAPNSHNSGVLALRGKRIVWTSEVDEGRRFNAARVKELVGGDTLSGRAPYGRDHIEFRPSHLLLLLTNAKPSANPSDYALWQRIHLIEFGISFVETPIDRREQPVDLRLADKLKAEGSGILAWMIRGCLRYSKEGLKVPHQVRAAVARYRAEEDILGNFISEQCVEADSAEIAKGVFYRAYKGWCDENGHSPLSSKRFYREMDARFDSYDAGRRWFFYQRIGLPQD